MSNPKEPEATRNMKKSGIVSIDNYLIKAKEIPNLLIKLA
jgi:hypothetical protein